MCKINSPHKYEASTGCVRETPQIKKEGKKKKKKAIMGCVRKTPHRNIKQDGMCKRNSQRKNKASAGCVRETPR